MEKRQIASYPSTGKNYSCAAREQSCEAMGGPSFHKVFLYPIGTYAYVHIWAWAFDHVQSLYIVALLCQQIRLPSDDEAVHFCGDGGALEWVHVVSYS